MGYHARCSSYFSLGGDCTLQQIPMWSIMRGSFSVYKGIGPGHLHVSAVPSPRHTLTSHASYLLWGVVHSAAPFLCVEPPPPPVYLPPCCAVSHAVVASHAQVPLVELHRSTEQGHRCRCAVQLVVHHPGVLVANNDVSTRSRGTRAMVVVCGIQAWLTGRAVLELLR